MLSHFTGMMMQKARADITIIASPLAADTTTTDQRSQKIAEIFTGAILTGKLRFR